MSTSQALAKPNTTNGTHSETEQWYQVNLLVFQHLKGKTTGEFSEQWPTEVELAYPKQTTSLHPLLKPNYNPLVQPLPNYSLMVDADAGFEKEKGNIRRSAGFRTLFYKQWYQKLGKGVTGQAVAIQGGKSTEKHQQLEGWVRFSQKRYLHLEVDLWLHDFDASGQLNGVQTSTLPVPIPEPDRLFSQLFDLGLPEIARWHASHRVSADSSTSAISGEPAVGAPAQPGSEAWSTPAMLALFKLSQADTERGTTTPFYIRSPKRTITYVMHQKRRMKSKTQHYLDHPLLGVLVEVIPYEREQIELLDKTTALWLRPNASAFQTNAAPTTEH
ncbi:MAG: hypothetical protein JKX83_10475 [Pseudomonadales bacterium]|nr:hypothetical protein [Pseudomonadales bacterium]